ncbi:hypothetical protein NIA71_17620 [Ihubacter massiliensis]|uniref:Polysaccharide deacetylase n=1 Tax=Hominibacterium faecale TaxID=2839743 RepID=A0A9J6QY57_9FIRM|nr:MULTISPECIES: hypothetical protein [Eubacteriales Family XIII. Incertae Sedis]MCO7123747.1 hypothetical protein [Ihubacter massiliensis]MCU7380402.1 hypothetical protein [Hominibacterium faecale]
MKIIVSHDVDHLYRDDHYKDLIYLKLWVRSTLEFFKREYGIREWFLRMCSPFRKERHRIYDMMEFDKKKGIPSTFFFGMENGLGMSYKRDKAVPLIKYVDEYGFEVGVHGIEYQHIEKMKQEYESFRRILQRNDFGMRMHYVRFDETSFEKLSKCGYQFDSTEFDKEVGTQIKKPYKVNGMWEFPLTIMDGYLPKEKNEKKEKTIELINKAEASGLPYLTLLFHDYQFCSGYASERDWYVWIISWLKDNGYEFISYRDAIDELEKRG